MNKSVDSRMLPSKLFSAETDKKLKIIQQCCSFSSYFTMSLQNTSAGSETCPGWNLTLEKWMWVCEEQGAKGICISPILWGFLYTLVQQIICEFRTNLGLKLTSFLSNIKRRLTPWPNRVYHCSSIFKIRILSWHLPWLDMCIAYYIFNGIFTSVLIKTRGCRRPWSRVKSSGLCTQGTYICPSQPIT